MYCVLQGRIEDTAPPKKRTRTHTTRREYIYTRFGNQPKDKKRFLHEIPGALKIRRRISTESSACADGSLPPRKCGCRAIVIVV